MSWKPERRQALLDEYRTLAQGPTDNSIVARRSEIQQEYEKGLPHPELSRSPFTGRKTAHSLDDQGLDGLWWDYNQPIRPVNESPGSTFFSLTGALAFGGPVEPAPFPRRPGPQAPFVVPRMLLHPDVKAVISTIRVGAHTGYSIVYYADPVPPLLARFNHWGANYYAYESDESWNSWDRLVEEEQEIDFDLGPWITSGDLLWIAPDDMSLTLRATLEGCPYLDLPGSQEWTVIAGS
ncbi:MAG TPA: hypothetical protein VG015_07715 [Candidatus Dormibacteraeota bacterium]|nr:hypothetical protein [Candidatus Dormibacteraeota bacterium]